MKIYLRILQYAPHAGSQFVKFLIYSIVASLLSAGYIGLLRPMLDILFLQNIQRIVPAPGEVNVYNGILKDLVRLSFYKHCSRAGTG